MKREDDERRQRRFASALFGCLHPTVDNFLRQKKFAIPLPPEVKKATKSSKKAEEKIAKRDITGFVISQETRTLWQDILDKKCTKPYVWQQIAVGGFNKLLGNAHFQYSCLFIIAFLAADLRHYAQNLVDYNTLALLVKTKRINVDKMVEMCGLPVRLFSIYSFYLISI